MLQCQTPTTAKDPTLLPTRLPSLTLTCKWLHDPTHLIAVPHCTCRISITQMHNCSSERKLTNSHPICPMCTQHMQRHYSLSSTAPYVHSASMQATAVATAKGPNSRLPTNPNSTPPLFNRTAPPQSHYHQHAHTLPPHPATSVAGPVPPAAQQGQAAQPTHPHHSSHSSTPPQGQAPQLPPDSPA